MTYRDAAMAWWLGGALLWLVAWMWLGARACAVSESAERRVGVLRKVGPAFVLTTIGLTTAILPSQHPAAYLLALWAHHVAFALLFLFLAAAQFLQAEAWWGIRAGRPTEWVARSYRRLWVMTEVVPAPVALTVLASGLRLIWEAPTRSAPASVWLMLMVAAFSAFFWDGIFWYQPAVRDLHAYWARETARSTPVAQAARGARSVGRSVQFLAHFLSLPVIFWLGVTRWDPANPVGSYLLRVEARLTFLPEGLPQVLWALVLWVTMGPLVLGVRAFAHRLATALSARRA
jgi:hypothetical protein